MVPGIAPPGTHPAAPPRVHPAADPGWLTALVGATGMYGRLNEVVGLKSVGQLTLGAVFSGSPGITEVYNLVEIGRIPNHYCIPGTK